MRKTALAIAAVLASACASRRDGPAPQVTAVAPAAICTAQRISLLSLAGEGFSPAVVGALTDAPSLALPQVFLAEGGAAVEIPPLHVSLPAESRDGKALLAEVPTGLVGPTTAGEPDVAYDVRVVNANGLAGALPDGLTVLAPPDLVSLAPAEGVQGTVARVALTGASFRPGMTVTLDTTPSVGGIGVTVGSATSATVDFNLAGVPAGTYGVTVSIPQGCSDTLAAAFTVKLPKVLHLTGIDPPFGWTGAATTVTLSSSGEFVSTPSVELRGTGAIAGETHQLGRVAFLSADTLTAVVPAGLPLGTWDVVVTNPPADTGQGTLAAAFRLVERPVPQVAALVPASGTTQAAQPVVIYGEHFRATAKVQLLDAAGTSVFSQAGLVPTDARHLSVTLPANTLAVGAYLVRVTNEDDGTYSTFSNFIVKSNSGNPELFAPSAALRTGRRLLAAGTADDDLGSHFVYAIGGDTGQAGTALATVEVSQLSKFGDLGGWTELPNRLVTARAGAAAVVVPVLDPAITDPVLAPLRPLRTYLYVLGGRSDSGQVLDTVERAVVLQARDAPRDLRVTGAADGDLEDGTWYYKVSAVLAAGHGDNPGGETLASDEAVARAQGGGVVLAWDPPAGNLPVSAYRVYRTPAVNGVSQTEVLVADGVTDTTFEDRGAAPLSPARPPLPNGSTGVWRVLPGKLGTARWGHAAVLATDDTTESAVPDRLVYVAGGMLADGSVTAGVEWAPLDGDGSAPQRGELGAFSAAGATPMAWRRAFFSMLVETRANASGYTPTTSRLWAISGLGGPAADTTVGVLNRIERSQVLVDGGNDAWVVKARTSETAAGTMSILTNDKVFILGGAAAATAAPAFSSILSSGRDTKLDSAGDIENSVNSVSGVIDQARPRALGAVVQQSGFYFLIGGTSTGTDALATTEHSF